MKSKVHTYRGQAITVTYEPRRCLHVAECLRLLPQVFNTFERPWVRVENGSPDEIAYTVEHCPTGALHYERTDGKPGEAAPPTNVLLVSPNGPYYARGNLEIVLSDGKVLSETRAAFCRCGSSRNKPFCDNTHRETGFMDAALQQPPPDLPELLHLTKSNLRVTPQLNGALRLEGPFEIRNSRGSVIYRGERAQLCRCGSSAEKPFCDSTHKRIGFKTEQE